MRVLRLTKPFLVLVGSSSEEPVCGMGKILGDRGAGNTSEGVERGVDTPHPGQDLLELRRKEYNSPSPPSCDAHFSSVLLFGSPPGHE